MQLFQAVGKELELYRQRRSIQDPLIARHRCWRLEYQDSINFHMDIVPCVPAELSYRRILNEALLKSGQASDDAAALSDSTVVITDDRHPRYKVICGDWHQSNPEGYARWFESRMNQGQSFELIEKAQIDKLPLFERRTPLQQAVQVLKRHRDYMFRENEDSKPISIIVTTIAAQAYAGEQSIGDALLSITSRMQSFIRSGSPRIPNPVNPAEDFSDRWARPECRHLNLEKNFLLWLQQVKSDIEILVSSSTASKINEQAIRKFAARLDEDRLAKSLGAASAGPASPKSHVITSETKPWRRKL